MTKAKKMERFSFSVYESRFSALGVVLVLIGLYYLGTHLGWWVELPFWPVIAIIAGVYLIVKKISYRRVL